MAKHIEELADTPFLRLMAAGHEARMGHELDAVNVSEDGVIWHMVRLCCGEAMDAVEED